jgi:hypothetical protein
MLLMTMMWSLKKGGNGSVLAVRRTNVATAEEADD